MAETEKKRVTTARQVNAVGPGKYTTNTKYLRLYVIGNSRSWVLRYRYAGKDNEIGLGAYPAVTLQEARDKAQQAAVLLAKGTDPRVEWRRATAAEPAVPTFISVAAQYIRAHRNGWRNRKHARQWVATLKTYARPVIGLTQINAVSTAQILEILQPIWQTKTETAKRVQGRIQNILDFAAARGWRDPINPARWQGHLDTLLPRPGRVAEAKHHPAMPFSELSAFMGLLDENSSISAKALKFLVLTACRTREALGARWDEFDFTTGIWTIPAERMKIKKEHRIPLSSAATEIVKSMVMLEGSPYVFPGVKPGKPLSNMTLLQLMRGMGYGASGSNGHCVPHGFRSTFKDWASDISPYPGDMSEMALAHTIPNKAEKAYRRSDQLEKRRAMMEDWAEFCYNSNGSNESSSP